MLPSHAGQSVTLNDHAAVLHSSPDGVQVEMRDDVIVLIKVASSRWTCLHRCHEVTLSDAKLVMGRAAIAKELRTEVRTPPMTKHWAHLTAFFQYCLRIEFGIAVATYAEM